MQRFIQSNPVINTVFVIILSAYFFWVGARRSNKNNNAIFDFWFLGAIVSLLYSRLSYFIVNWSVLSFDSIGWFWIPYEKYDDALYIFRLYPWRFFRFWDQEFLFSGILVGMLFSIYILSILRKGWRIKDMFVPLWMATTVLFTGILFPAAIINNDNRSMILLLWMWVGILTVWLLSKVVEGFFVKKFPKYVIEIWLLLMIIGTMFYNVFLMRLFNVEGISFLDLFNVKTFAIGTFVILMHAYLEEKYIQIKAKSRVNIGGRRKMLRVDINTPIIPV